jgi:uncharacterized protein YqgC (DUF456 family)
MSDNITATRSAATGRPLNILLWCVQALLALEFVGVLHVPPTAPVVLFLLSGFVVWGRRKDLFAE